MASEEACAAIAGFVANLANPSDYHNDYNLTNGDLALHLPGPDSVSKKTLEQELSALAARIHALQRSKREVPAENGLPTSSGSDAGVTHSRRDSQASIIKTILAPRTNGVTESKRGDAAQRYPAGVDPQPCGPPGRTDPHAEGHNRDCQRAACAAAGPHAESARWTGEWHG
ncbi:hypothetical protein MRB53_038111 [Persea americana]|nr:hypothetical protein MRB53_038111 [Persea americana]